MNKEKVVRRAKEIIGGLNDPVHGLSHMERTLSYALEIAESYPETDRDILEIDVWWHDVGRAICDEGHVAKSGDIVKAEFEKLDMNQAITERVFADVISHNSSYIGGRSLEAKILLDADKLEFLTPARWQEAIEAKDFDSLQIGIYKVPIIRDRILMLERSKEIYDRIYGDLIGYLKGIKLSSFEKFKKEIELKWNINLGEE